MKGNTWIDKIHHASGHWKIEKKDNQDVFLLEADFTTLPGPDLQIYLNTKSIDQILPREQLDLDQVHLGELKAYSGLQEYALPIDFETGKYKSLAIFCRHYSVVWSGIDF